MKVETRVSLALNLICIMFLVIMLSGLALHQKFNEIRVISEIPLAFEADVQIYQEESGYYDTLITFDNKRYERSCERYCAYNENHDYTCLINCKEVEQYEN